MTKPDASSETSRETRREGAASVSRTLRDLYPLHTPNEADDREEGFATVDSPPEVQGEKGGTSPRAKHVLARSIGISALVSVLALVFPEQFFSVTSDVKSWISTNFGWYYLLLVFVIVIACIAFTLSPVGTIRLGDPTDRPKLSTTSWIAMLFSAGMGIGLVFWGAAEPLAHYDPARQAWIQKWTLFYWAWWIAWSPFVGVFIARISRGRSIREFLACVILIPAIFSCLWFATFGTMSTSVELEGYAISALLAAGGLDALQNVLIITALPFSIVIMLMLISLVKELRHERLMMGLFVRPMNYPDEDRPFRSYEDEEPIDPVATTMQQISVMQKVSEIASAVEAEGSEEP